MKNFKKRMIQRVSCSVSEKKQLRKGVLLLWIFFLTVPVLAQNITVSGVVVDNIGSALPGVNVSVKGNPNLGVSTGLKGEYSLSVPNQNAILEFSYIGYVTQDIPVGNKTRINVTLLEDVKALDEVVVIGYGVQKRSDVTGAVGSVREADLTNRTELNAATAIQGKVAGIQVLNTTGRPGEGSDIRIRGYSSNNAGSTSPLYVVDGLIVDNIQYLDPQMINSIEILKDAASASIYGAQAGNGVVLIQTKRAKVGEGRVFYNYLLTNNRLGNIPKTLNAAQFIEYKKEEAGSNFENPKNIDTNWFDATFEPSNTQSHTFGFQGANDRGSLFLSFNYVNDQGMMKGPYDYYKRLTTQINAEYKIKSWLTVGTNNSIEKWERVQMGDRSNWAAPMLVVLRGSPLTPAYYDDFESLPNDMKNVINNPNDKREVLKGPNGKYYGVNPGLSLGSSLIGIEREKNNKNEGINMRGTFYANFSPIKGLVYTSRFGYRISSGFNSNYTAPFYASNNSQTPDYNITAGSSSGWYYQWDNFVNFNKSIKKNNIGAMVGMTYVQNESRGVNGGQSGSDPLTGYDENFRYIMYITSNGTRTLGGSYSTNVNMGYFGRLTWNYDNRYNLQANFRADAFDSSRLAENNRWGYFPSFSAGWTLSNESFMKDLAKNIQMDNLKLRAAWGRNGNVNSVSNYQYNASITAAGDNWYQFIPGDGTFIQGRKPNGLVNKDLKWETLEQTDLGLEARFLRNRLSFTVDYYNKETKDLLVPIAPKAEVGVTSNLTINAGNVVNKGLEFELGWQDKKGDFKYSVNANLSTVNNKVTYLNPALQRITYDAGMMNARSNTAFEQGFPLFYFRGHDYLGVAKADGFYKDKDGKDVTAYKAGDPLFKDMTGDGRITDDDLHMIGSGIPKFTYGITVDVAYKNFDLNVFGTGVSGNDIFLYYYDCSADINQNLLALYYDKRWTPDNPNGTLPYPGREKVNFFSSSANLFKGDFFRIKQIQLGYNVPSSLLKKIFVSNLRVFASLNDYITITKYPGFDPEASSGNTGTRLGVDLGNYPISKKVFMGVNISF